MDYKNKYTTFEDIVSGTFNICGQVLDASKIIGSDYSFSDSDSTLTIKLDTSKWNFRLKKQVLFSYQLNINDEANAPCAVSDINTLISSQIDYQITCNSAANPNYPNNFACSFSIGGIIYQIITSYTDCKIFFCTTPYDIYIQYYDKKDCLNDTDSCTGYTNSISFSETWQNHQLPKNDGWYVYYIEGTKKQLFWDTWTQSSRNNAVTSCLWKSPTQITSTSTSGTVNASTTEYPDQYYYSSSSSSSTTYISCYFSYDGIHFYVFYSNGQVGAYSSSTSSKLNDSDINISITINSNSVSYTITP